ncbi:MAG: hypothetical protein J6T56_07825 [Bacteroidales bacterium]|nr:hypothetical protein [Bacteroidales bacterium]
MKMKKLLVTALLALMFGAVSAQNEHLTFKGVPIDGNAQEFTQKMCMKGFSVLKNRNDLILLQGSFSGKPNCKVIVNTLEKEEIVSSVQVIFERENTWMALSNDYDSLKSMLTDKYGQPTDVKEQFVNLYSEEDFLKIIRLQANDCEWRSAFETGLGQIVLSIVYDMEYGCHVLLEYRDRINCMRQRNVAMDDL